MDDEGNAADDAMTELLERAGIQSSATMNLIVFSFLMFTVPLSVMYVTYRYLFIEYLHLTRDRAALYAGVMGIAVAYLIVVIFIWLAHREESMLCEMSAEQKKSE